MPAYITLPMLLAGLEIANGRREASPEVMKDYVHAVKFYLLDGLPEPPRQVPYGLVFMFQNSL